MKKTYSFQAAVRGYHYYGKHWNLVESDKLLCMHKPRPCFDRFATEVMNESGEIVGYLPREHSRITK